ncbi:MAG: hypothetical protein KatS3mg111_2528 [Pirellulaceae bacterium]|nr:MAG: hypothetical protein KatS3mg111_2528 [Pirellulaceae bacterium]
MQVYRASPYCWSPAWSWRSLLVYVLILVSLLATRPLMAQQERSVGNTENSATDRGPQRQGLHFNSLGLMPQTIVYPGGTLVLRATVSNYSTSTEEGMLVATVDGVTHLQSGRRFALPPRSLEHLPIYIQVPRSVAGKDKVEVHVMLMVERDGREVIQDQLGQPAEHRLTLDVARKPSMAALMLDPEPPHQMDWQWPPAPAHWSFELVIGGRIDAGGNRLTASFDHGQYPLNQEDWKAVDLMVISQADAFRDAALIDALKSFVARGGRLWIMLDAVPCADVRPLLGVGQSIEEIDTTEINSGVVELFHSPVELAPTDRTIDSDVPLRLVRVVQTGGRVTHTLDGWPLAIWMPQGHGEILFTTLEPRAWIEPRPQDPANIDVYQQSQFTTPAWSRPLALEINTAAGELPTYREFDYAVQSIGNPVVPRRWIAVGLIGFCGIIAALSVVAWRGGATSLMLGGAPVTAVIVSGIFLVAAQRLRHDIEPGVARLQLVQVTDDGSRAIVSEQGALYLDRQSSSALHFDEDGQARPTEPLAAGVRRFEVIDFQRWRLTSSEWPAGIGLYRSDYRLPWLDGTAVAHLDRDGLHLQLPPQLGPLEDVLLAYAIGQPMVCQQGRDVREVTCDGRLPATGDRWIADALLSNEQLRRIDVYKRFFAPLEHRRPLQRYLFGWTALTAVRPQWTDSLQERGAALVAIPVQLVRPPAGRQVYVPAGLVQLRTDETAIGQTATYDNETGRWASELTLRTQARMQFELPSQLVPFDAERLELELDMRAPHRRVGLHVVRPSGDWYPIVQLDSPSLPWRGNLEAPEVLEAVRDGKLRIVLEVSERMDVANPNQAANVVTWEVRRLALAVRGKVAPVLPPAPSTASR